MRIHPLLCLVIPLITTANLSAAIVQVKPLAPVFITINDNTPTQLNLNDYFLDDLGIPLGFHIEKKSPGVNISYTSDGEVSLVPHVNFLGKTTFDIVFLSETTEIYQLDVYVKVSDEMVNDCNIHVVNIGVYNFDPYMPQYNAVCHNAYNWNDPIELTEDYFDAIAETSGDFVYLNLTYWLDINDWGVKEDGFKYDAETYDDCRTGNGCHSPDIIDYPAVISQYGVDTLVQNYHAEEIWFWGGPEFGYWEASMACQSAYFINGGVFPEVETDMPFAIMGFNYERGVAEMLHSNGHRVENHMKRAYNNQWNLANPVTNWDLYTANVGQSDVSLYGIGNIHFPANGTADYDYANTNYVEARVFDYGYTYPSTAHDGFASVNRETWGGPDYQLGYMKWWFENLPKNNGINPADGRLNNWWKYVYDFRNYNNTTGQSTNNPAAFADFTPDFTLQAEEVGLTYLYDLASYMWDTPMSYPNFYSPSNLILKGTKVYFFNDGTAGRHIMEIMMCDDEEGSNLVSFTVDVIRDIRVNPKFILGGAYSNSGMQHHLYDMNRLPLTDPYGLGTFVDEIPADVVDWVVVELRYPELPTHIIDHRACFLHKDGHIIDVDGSIGAKFEDTWVTEAYVAVRHRNHLGVMSAEPIAILE